MSEIDLFDQSLEGLQTLQSGKYENCTFRNCHLEGTNLSESEFIDCEFISCDLSNTTLTNTGLKDVRFSNCKLLGLHFEDCNPFLLEVHFEKCQLDLSTFYGLKLPKTRFHQCSLREVDFTESDLSQSSFGGCDLSGATFERTNLTKADLREAEHFNINPNLNTLKKARFSRMDLAGLLTTFDLDIR
ncbi:pentapeptide repeat-containing protein [Marinoscillum furvescens]|uniref:Uncharacterized protein YjbI with pentapeptide repeats n=1 Tax=Marinoscillum furvescens DSM 4134 TaxID=1122208 RepID=A0A3D9L3Z5_MARFU|nr:pentapeptide repeat-containing protein [Marinoscillum furvescens]REE00075.1 uncharacterized protein YjbI with pentapeptide repeats [Marinoscillum furvescens DSM 4134]